MHALVMIALKPSVCVCTIVYGYSYFIMLVQLCTMQIIVNVMG